MLYRKHEWENTTKKASNRYLNISQRSNIKEVVEMGAVENNVHFWHLLGILKLTWYLKSRFVGTHRCCQQRHTALTALQAALFGAT